jgi:2-hydroxychromene-2-carboxylate isomerase
MPALDFWYEFASTYSYPAAMRVEALAQQSGVAVRWRPFLLGPLFAESGWRDSPFNLYPVKGRYMWRDLERICESLGLPFARPDPFPQSTLLVARVALALEESLRPAFSRTVYDAEFGKRRAIADRAVVAELLSEAGADPQDVLSRAESPQNKAALKTVCQEAKDLGLPGAPCFVTARGEVFWGNDRLEAALEWALRT